LYSPGRGLGSYAKRSVRVNSYASKSELGPKGTLLERGVFLAKDFSRLDSDIGPSIIKMDRCGAESEPRFGTNLGNYVEAAAISVNLGSESEEV